MSASLIQPIAASGFVYDCGHLSQALEYLSLHVFYFLNDAIRILAFGSALAAAFWQRQLDFSLV